MNSKLQTRLSEEFAWGHVIDVFKINMDGKECTILKFHPWVSENGSVRVGRPDETVVNFHNAETRWSDTSIQASMIRWIAHQNLGLNQQALVAGVCKALDVKEATA